jgi:hypothetical protein
VVVTTQSSVLTPLQTIRHPGQVLQRLIIAGRSLATGTHQKGPEALQITRLRISSDHQLLSALLV